MSVQTQIDRLTGAKTDIAAAIADKGVTVPDGTLLDGMAALIASIQVSDETVKQATVTTSNTTVSSTITFSGITGQPREGAICMNDAEWDTGGNRHYVIYGSSLSNTAELVKASSSSVSVGVSAVTATYASANFSIQVTGLNNRFRPGSAYTLYYKT